VSQRLDQVLDQNQVIFARIARILEEVWRAQGTKRPSPDKEHWFLLAGEDNEEKNGNTSITFKLHSGQRSYIDRISRNKTVLLTTPAANGVDLRQSTKTMNASPSRR
jgi:hypothetical protein